jgi:hypothetical protein
VGGTAGGSVLMRYGVYRTVRKGRVKIGGRHYRPVGHHLAYDGRCDGHRFLFGRYDKPGGGWEPFVNLWGTEAAAKSPNLDDVMEGPHIVDGTFPWDWWEAEGSV